jgi:hypothetical protein
MEHKQMKFPQWLKVFGDQDFRGDCPTERAEQVTFFARLRREYPDSYGLIAVHPRNEGKRHMMQVAREKADGMTPGASDIIIPGRVAFVCELKRRDHTVCSWGDKQLDYLQQSQKAGAFACVALGCDAAWEAFNEWRRVVEQ